MAQVTTSMTVNNAKRIIVGWLKECNVSYTKVTARTISFMDLARGDCIFVKIHGFQFNPAFPKRFAQMEAIARINGFRIEE